VQDDRRRPLERFEIIVITRKVVGVGSVGTGAYIVLLQGRDQQDPLFLQIKQATTLGQMREEERTMRRRALPRRI
jgi:uncharacterized protein (DUF2252 family)